MNGQGLGGMGFSGGIGQPSAHGFAPGQGATGPSYGFGGGGGLLDMSNMLKLLGFQGTLGEHNMGASHWFRQNYGKTMSPYAVQQAFGNLLTQRLAQPPASPSPLSPPPSTPMPAVRPGPLTPQAVASPYAGLLGGGPAPQQQMGLLQRMLASQNRMQRPGIA